MAILDSTRNRRHMTRTARALGLATALLVTLPLGILRPAARAQDAGKKAQSKTGEKNSLRGKTSQLLIKARRAIREERFDDACRLAGETLGIDPEDESAKDIQSRAIAGKLEQRLSLDFRDTPLEEVVSYLADASGIDMILDPDGIENRKPQITLKVEAMPLENALDVILRRFAKMDYITLGDRIYISNEGGMTVYALRTYDVRDLVSGSGDSRLDAEGGVRAASLVRLVMTFVNPESWRYAPVAREGSNRDIRVEVPNTREAPGGGMVFINGELIVRQTRALHGEIAKFLVAIRQNRKGPVGPVALPRATGSDTPTSKEARLTAQAWQAILEQRFDDARRIAGEILAIDPGDVLARIIQDRASDERPVDGASQLRQQMWKEQRLCIERPLRRKAAQRPTVGRRAQTGSGVVRDTPGVVRIKEQLDQEISLESRDTPVTDIVAYLHDVSGINMMLDPDALDDEQRISVKADGTRLKTVLNVILRQLAHLDYIVRDDGLFISNEEGLSEFGLRTYDVRDLVAGSRAWGRPNQEGAGAEQRAVCLLALVTTVVSSDSWRYAFISGAGGGGDREIGHAGENEEVWAGIVFREGDLIVWQTPKLHAPPPDLDPNDAEAVRAWGRKSGADAMAEAGSEVPGLICSHMIAQPVRAREWHALASPALRQCWEASGSGPRTKRIRASSDRDLPATYAFRTREGSVGVLQIVGSIDGDPGGVGIRYKLLKWQLWATAGHNLLANPGFEDGDSLPTHWEPFDYSNRVLSCRDTLVKYRGTASLRLSRVESPFASIDNMCQEMRSVLPGGRLSVSAYVRAEGVETALIDVAFLNGVGECIKHERVGDVIRATHDWRKYSGVFTVPANATDALVCLETGGAGTVWFDDLVASLAE